jgi:hypothetical protein
MSKRKVEFELDVNKLAAWVAVIVPVVGGLWWIWNAGETHELVVDHKPRIETLEKNNEEYEDLWAQQIKDRKQYIEKAVEVCKKAGKCN